MMKIARTSLNPGDEATDDDFVPPELADSKLTLGEWVALYPNGHPPRIYSSRVVYDVEAVKVDSPVVIFIIPSQGRWALPASSLARNFIPAKDAPDVLERLRPKGMPASFREESDRQRANKVAALRQEIVEVQATTALTWPVQFQRGDALFYTATKVVEALGSHHASDSITRVRFRPCDPSESAWRIEISISDGRYCGAEWDVDRDQLFEAWHKTFGA
jgi:hypothetical protein